jgi:hypothetical protein
MIAHIYPSVLQAVSGRGYAGCLDGCFQGCRGDAMQDLGYELPRILIPRTRVNKGKLHTGLPKIRLGSCRSPPTSLPAQRIAAI